MTWRDLEARLSALADLLDNLAEPADRGLTNDLWGASGTCRYLATTVRELADRCLE